MELNCAVHSTENTEGLPVLVIKYNNVYERLVTGTSNSVFQVCEAPENYSNAAFPGT